MQQFPLSGLPAGETGYVYSIALPQAQQQRLGDLGLAPESAVRRRFTAPGGSPIAFEIKGAVIALRRADCDRISVCCRD